MEEVAIDAARDDVSESGVDGLRGGGAGGGVENGDSTGARIVVYVEGGRPGDCGDGAGEEVAVRARVGREMQFVVGVACGGCGGETGLLAG